MVVGEGDGCWGLVAVEVRAGAGDVAEALRLRRGTARGEWGDEVAVAVDH